MIKSTDSLNTLSALLIESWVVNNLPTMNEKKRRELEKIAENVTRRIRYIVCGQGGIISDNLVKLEVDKFQNILVPNISDDYFFDHKDEIIPGVIRIFKKVNETRERARQNIPPPQTPSLSNDWKQLLSCFTLVLSAIGIPIFLLLIA